MIDQIEIRGARLHNLKNVSLTIPKYKLVVLTGLSGSGKSTLGFDILFKEGQRQYLESLGMVSYDLAKPPVDTIRGLSPSISIDQHLTNRSPRSTVGTATDVYTYLRVLFARLGHFPCPNCGEDIQPTFDPASQEWESDSEMEGGAAASPETFPCPRCGAPLEQLSMAHFSFNKPEGACPTCTGLGVIKQANVQRLVDKQKSILEGAVNGWDKNYLQYSSTLLKAAANYYGFELDLSLPVKDFTPIQRDLLLYGVESPIFRRHFPGIQPPRLVRQGRFEGVATNLLRRYAERIHDADYREKLDEYLVTHTCPDCAGTRLRLASRQVTVHGRTIIDIALLSLHEIGAWLDGLPGLLNTDEMLVAASILEDLKRRIDNLVEVGAGYLTLERSSPTLSAGEAQRLRLASLLGSGLSGVLYVFDEPTIGTHQRDTLRLINVLRRLRDLGNTVLVIEHDLEMIAAADYVVDLGPGAGKHGGQVVAAGAPADIAAHPGSITADYLAGRVAIHVPERRHISTEAGQTGAVITILGARQHNLKDINVRLPLGMLIAVTGVSGSGKTSLVFDVLDRAIRKQLYQSDDIPGDHDSVEGVQYLDKIITIDQHHIGRLPRSNAATYTDTFTPIRNAFASTDEARRLKLNARHFSFNLPGGRCERCKGAGVLTVSMHFLPDVEVRCPVCHGRRFTSKTLSVHYRGYDISQVLDMTVEEALDLFEAVPSARSRLQVLLDVGLGYLQLGQPATTLSGGEAQRVKLAKELGRRVSGRTLYLLDEPTTGLHLADVARLLGVLQRLVDAGNTVILVEHNLQLIKAADWIIDLGPEGGAAGGELLAQGTPEQVAQVPGSHTGHYLREILLQ